MTEQQFKGIVYSVSDMYPYKVAGNAETYSQYNEGWSDACGVILAKLSDSSPDKSGAEENKSALELLQYETGAFEGDSNLRSEVISAMHTHATNCVNRAVKDRDKRHGDVIGTMYAQIVDATRNVQHLQSALTEAQQQIKDKDERIWELERQLNLVKTNSTTK